MAHDSSISNGRVVTASSIPQLGKIRNTFEQVYANSLHFGPPATFLERFSDASGTVLCYNEVADRIYHGQREAMIGERQEYQAYLVRLWQVRSSGQWVWRAALESPHTGERQVFADLPGLFAYLERQTSGLDLIEPAEDRPGDD
jgi:hypothetical protein